VQDLGRARRFSAVELDLEPDEERPGGLRYRCASGEFALFESAGAASGAHTGTAERGAWFRDSEGNLLGIGQPIR
jgi:hypothetical protein